MVVLERAARGVPHLHAQAHHAFCAGEQRGVRRWAERVGQVVIRNREGAYLLVGVSVSGTEYGKIRRGIEICRVLPHGVGEHHRFVQRLVEVELQVVVAKVAAPRVVPVRRPESSGVVVYQQAVVCTLGGRRLVTRNLPCIQYQVLLIIAPARIIGRRRHGQARRMGVDPVQAARKRHGPKRQTA